eukprot:425260_1
MGRTKITPRKSAGGCAPLTYNEDGFFYEVINSNDNYPQIGQLVEYEFGINKIPHLAQIIKVKDTNIWINGYGSDQISCCIDKDSNSLALLHTNIFSIIPLQKSYRRLNGSPVICNCSILIGKHKYNINSNDWSFTVSSNTISGHISDPAIYNKKTNEIYYIKHNGEISVLKLNNNEFVENTNNPNINIEIEQKYCGYALENNKLYVTQFKNEQPNYIYNIERKEWIKIEKEPIIRKNHLYNKHVFKIIYIQSQKKFMAIIYAANQNPKMIAYYCQYDKSIWNIDTKFKFDENLNDVINICDHLLLIRINNVEIAFFDLFTSKIFKSTKTLPVITDPNDGNYMINSMDNFIHFLNGTNYCPEAKKIHFKIHLTDIIPTELDKSYRYNKCNKLIFGFIKRIQQQYNLSMNIPYYLKRMINNYYPC